MSLDWYEVDAVYTVDKTLTVSVAKGENPSDPGTWIDIEDEHDRDCHLYDITSIKLAGDNR